MQDRRVEDCARRFRVAIACLGAAGFDDGHDVRQLTFEPPKRDLLLNLRGFSLVVSRFAHFRYHDKICCKSGKLRAVDRIRDGRSQANVVLQNQRKREIVNCMGEVAARCLVQRGPARIPSAHCTP